MKKELGFTLIELSIVIIIIGLLISGILIGQTLVDSAKINRQISEFQQYDSATLAFKAKYKYLPGDAPGFGGNGDGLIGRKIVWAACLTGTMDNINAVSGEIANFWNQIMPGKYNSTGYTTVLYRDSFVNKIPPSSLGVKAGFITAFSLASTTTQYFCADNDARENYYTITSPSSYPAYTNEPYNGTNRTTFHSVLAGDSALTVNEMMTLDKKLDDGIANAGIVIAGSYATGNSGISKIATATCSSGANYLVANSGYQCTPMIRIGGQASPQ